MKDLTQGAVSRHVLSMSAPVLAFMIFQALYLLVDLYFVAHLGEAAVAGVGAAANVALICSAFTQVLAAGAVALISQAAGRKHIKDANVVFNQSMLLALICGVGMLIGGYSLTRTYVTSLATDSAVVIAGVTYVYWFLPSLALQFVMQAIGSLLRGFGIVKPTMLIYAAILVLNIVLAPVLIVGWGTGRPLGVAGAGLATSVSMSAGVALIWLYSRALRPGIALDRKLMRPDWSQWRRILSIGMPAGAELALMFVYTALIYRIIQEFGVSAQAGFGVGSRILQVLLLPSVAISFAIGPVVGHNFGAGEAKRVRDTFQAASILSTGCMLVMMAVVWLYPTALIRIFTHEPQTIVVGELYLQLTSLGLVAYGMIYACSGVFLGLGNLRPSLLSSGVALLMFISVAATLSANPGFRIEHVWCLWTATITLQAIVSISLLRIEFHRRLSPTA